MRINDFHPMMSFYQERYFLHLAIKCSSCHRSIRHRHAEILREEDDAQLLFARCPLCHQSIIFLMVETDHGWETIGMKTDLKKGEVDLLFDRRPISLDDVLDVHELLRSSQGKKALNALKIKQHHHQ